MNQKRRYFSYLLRLWQESRGDAPHGDPARDPPLWRASLEKPHAAGCLGFQSLADLFAFLESETGTGAPVPARSDAKGCQPPAKPE